MAARTWSELDPLVDDLPDPPEVDEDPAKPQEKPLMSPVAAGVSATAVLALAVLSIVLSFGSA